jgi:histidine triad (HIT) family protein
MSDECVFCKIVEGTVPSTKIFEDDEVYAFLDIAPINPGHTLVVPKKHSKDITDISDEYLCNVIKKVKKIAVHIKDALDLEGFNISLNNGEIAGQTVPHTHFHIIPRHRNDNMKNWPHKDYRDGEAEKVAKKIRNKISINK